MQKTGIFYGSTTGTTAAIAADIARKLGVNEADVHNVSETSPDAFGKYDVLILGTSTWGSGDLQEDWYDFISGIEVLDLKRKKIALFGCGDETMSDTFCNAVGTLYDRLQPTGATFIAPYDTVGYSFNSSSAVRDGIGVGLLLDEVNHPEATGIRLQGWINEISDAIR